MIKRNYQNWGLIPAILQGIKLFPSLVLIAGCVTVFSCKSERQKLSEEITSGEEKLFNDSSKTLNTDVANDVLRKYIAYADANKDDTLSVNYLFRAGDLANGLHRPEEAIAIYERLRVSYPESKKSSVALFMEAFIYETVLQNKERAKTTYKKFLDDYPDHKLAPSAQASLDQLNANLSDEDLIKMFEKNMK